MAFTAAVDRKTPWFALCLTVLAVACAPGEPISDGFSPSGDQVVGLHLVPDSVSLQAGEFVDLAAIAELRDGGTGLVAVTWQASGGSITSNGRFTAGSVAGLFGVVAHYSNGLEDTASIVVTVTQVPVPVLSRIFVSPGTAALLPSATQQFGVTGVMSDATNAGAVPVTWTANGGSISSSGLYSAPASAGNYTVVATHATGLADTAEVAVAVPPATLASVILTPGNSALEFGRTQQFAAVGQLSDGSSSTIPITWTATGGTVSGSGLFTAGSTAGAFRVIARAANGMADTSAITVSAPTVSSITVTPASFALQSGQTRQLSASASMTNGTTQSNPAVSWTATGGSINTTGLYTAGATAGTFQVIASSANGRADTSAVTISLPTVSSVSMTPATVTLPTSGTQQFTTSAVLSNGITQSNPSVTYAATGGTVSTNGLYTAGSTAGTFRVIVTSNEGPADTSSVTITATAPVITAIVLTPATVSLQPGQTQAFSASATMSNGSTQANPTVTYSVTGGTMNAGTYTAGNTAGSFRVIATANGVADTSTVTISAATITAITMTPATVSLQSGQTQQFTLSATMSNGTTQANPSVTYNVTGGTISGSTYTAGSTAGNFRVIATANGVADTSAVTITAATVTAINVNPTDFSVFTSGTQQLTASATLSNGSTQSNPSVTWSATGGTVSTNGLYTAGATAGSFRVIAVQQGGSLADTVAVTITTQSAGGTYPHKPAGYNNVIDWNSSAAVPTGSANERPIGSTGWSVIYDLGSNGSNFSKISDPSAPMTPGDVWQLKQPAGDYGTLYEGSGSGFGNLFRPLPNGVTSLYISLWAKWSPGYYFHPVSHKFINLFTNQAGGDFLVQLAHYGQYFEPIDILPDRVFEPQVSNKPALGVWHQVEVQVVRGNPGIIRVWVDGQLTTEYTNLPVVPNQNFIEFGIYGYLGGGGFDLAQDQYQWIDHITLAYP